MNARVSLPVPMVRCPEAFGPCLAVAVRRDDQVMAVSYQHQLNRSRTADSSSATDPVAPPEVLLINWRAVRRAEHACCCTARPAVVAVMPPGPGRAHRTELLLCGHHYRVSLVALAAARAVVVDMAGIPLAGHEWPEHLAVTATRA